MPITHLQSLADLDTALAASRQQPVLIFKHSTRCSLSASADAQYHHFVGQHPEAKVLCTHLDLLRHRDVSHAIAERLGIRHASPQALLVSQGRVIWHASHGAITSAALAAALAAVPA
jgi:bacillithiol system protein YtxJ